MEASGAWIGIGGLVVAFLTLAWSVLDSNRRAANAAANAVAKDREGLRGELMDAISAVRRSAKDETDLHRAQVKETFIERDQRLREDREDARRREARWEEMFRRLENKIDRLLTGRAGAEHGD